MNVLRRILSSVLLSTFALAYSVHADSLDNAYALFKKAEQELAENDFDAAVRLAKQAISLHNDDGEIIINATVRLQKVGNRRASYVTAYRDGDAVQYRPNELLRLTAEKRAEQIRLAKRRLKTSTPPVLVINAKIDEEVADGYVQSLEPLTLNITLENKGFGSAEKLQLQIGEVNKVVTRTFELDRLNAGESERFTLPFSIPMEFKHEDLEITLKAWETDGFKAENIVLKQTLTPWVEPNLELIGISGPEILSAGQVANFSFKLKNNDPYPIWQQRFSLEFEGTGIRNMLSEWPVSHPLIMPGEVVNLPYKVFAQNNIVETTIAEVRLNTNVPVNYITELLAPTKRITVADTPGIIQYGNMLATNSIETPVLIQDAFAPSLQNTAPQHQNRYALVIGNGNYKNIKQRVRYAHNDAKLMTEVFEKALGIPDTQIFTHFDMTLAEMQSWLGSQQHSGSLHRMLEAEANHNTDLYVYYSGHGSPAVNHNWSAYLTPYDANPDYIEHTGYALSQLYQQLAELPVNRVFVMLDACFSGEANDGLIFENVSPVLLKTVNISTPHKADRISVISAASANDMSLWLDQAKHGLFTTFLAKGLAGEAASNNTITTGGLFNYISKHVRSTAARMQRHQTPMLTGDPAWIITHD